MNHTADAVVIGGGIMGAKAKIMNPMTTVRV